jgi:hypothetical protein
MLDADLRFRFPGLVSTTASGMLPLGYAGLRDGIGHGFSFLEEGREALGAPTAAHAQRPVGRRQLARAAELFADVDLLAVGCTANLVRRLPRERSLTLPLRIHYVVPTGGDVDEIRRRVSKKDRQRLGKSERDRGWTLERADGAADFEFFFERMHRPTMVKRHGSKTRSESKDVARECLFRRGHVFFVTEDGARVAGALCRWEPRERMLLMRLAGVLDGLEEHYRSGVFLALYVLVLEWANRNGAACVELSGSEAFVSKGIFQFKRKLHPQIVVPETHYHSKRLWLHVVRDTPAVRDLLVANPPIVLADDGELAATFFADADRPARELPWQCPGVERRLDVDLDEFLAGAPQFAGSEPESNARPRAGHPGLIGTPS